MSDQTIYHVESTFIHSSDRWIHRMYNEAEDLVGLNFVQGYDSYSDLIWLQPDTTLWSLVHYLTKQLSLNNNLDELTLGELDSLLWRAFEIREIIENGGIQYQKENI